MSQTFERSLQTIPESLRPAVEVRWQSFLDAHTGVPALADNIISTLPMVWMASDFVAQSCIRDTQSFMQLAESELANPYDWDAYESKLAFLLETVCTEEELHRTLRNFRQREMLRIIWRDIAAWADLSETTRDLSHLAEACIEQSLNCLYRWQCEELGTPRDAKGNNMNLVVLGMGKLGAWELNLSSDIDLIFAFAEEGEISDGPRPLANSEFFIRLGQKLISALDQQTVDGFVFRVDMRLRPFGDGGALVSSFAAMENYYTMHGREWERYAMIKARVVGGDRQAGEELMAMLKPFVYRRYLDFGAYESLREMKGLIKREVNRKGMEQNVKLGAGGIREVEFIGQVFQLIRGGRDSQLTARKIMKVLDHLGQQDYLPEYVVTELITAYRFLRIVEHRLQAWQDKQTHVLPNDETGKLRLAVSLGYDNWDTFINELDHHRQRVQHHFEQVFEAPQTDAANDDEVDLNSVWHASLDEQTNIKVLEQTGYLDSKQVLGQLDELRQGRMFHSLSKRGRERMDQLMPLLLGAAAKAQQPDVTIERLLQLINHIARRSVYLALLVENPLALSQLVRLTDASPWIIHYLEKYPLLLDELLDPRSLYAPPDKSQLGVELSRLLTGIETEDQEQVMDILRQFKHSNVLKVAAADISEALPLMKVSDHLTWIAETVLEEALAQAWNHMVARHGYPAGITAEDGERKGFAIIGYGKLGGFELGYGSDLDLVFLYDTQSDNAMTSGEHAIAVPVYYARLGQRLIHILTVFTSSGILYETDMRLRPDGASGMLVSSLKAFSAYQRDKAWLWEHQALIRARKVAGDNAVGETFEKIRKELLSQPRQTEKLKKEVLSMREKMQQSLDKSSDKLFDIKQGSGGLVDIEFLVQYFVLDNAQQHPELLTYTDNIRILEMLPGVKQISEQHSAILIDAYRAFRGRLHRRALAEKTGPVDASEFKQQRREVRNIWQHYFQL